MANYTTTITNEGAALLASVIANQGTLTFNEFRFSENDYTGQESTLTEGTFLGVFITAGAVASVIDSTTIKASAQFDNSTITGNHDLYSIGIVGTDGNTTALIAVCTTTDPDVIREPLTGTSTYAFNVNLSVSDTSQITVVGTTAAVIYDIDVVDNLTSPATNKPLSANQGRLVADNLAANENVYGAKNLWNIEKWLNDIGQAFTKSGDVYTTTISDARTNTNKCVFSDTDIEVTLSAELTASGSMQFYVELFDSNDNNVGSISLSNPTFTGIGCKVRFNFNNTGTVTLTAPMLRDARIIDPKFAPFAETNLQLTRKTSGQSNENLLDNGWFTVNQRGFMSHVMDTTYFPTVDRWIGVAGSYGGTITLGASGINFNKEGYSSQFYFTQKMEGLVVGKVYTLSVLFSDGTIEYGTGTINSTSDKVEFAFSGLRGLARTYYYTYWSQWLTDIVTYAGANFTVRAIKLEVGSVSTLANDVAPNYTTELLKCQRYFKVALNDTWNVGIGVVMATDTIEFYYFSDVPMRATPSVSTVGAITAVRIADGSEVAISSVEVSLDLNTKNGRIYFKTSTTLTIRDLYVLRMNNAKVMLSADL